MRLDANDYSVHPSVIGRRVEICAGLDEVAVTYGGAQVSSITLSKGVGQGERTPSRYERLARV